MSTQATPRPKMDVRYINPFVDAVVNVFETMLSIKPQRQTLKLSPQPKQGTATLTSIIGMSGQVHGVVALRFEPDAALAFAGTLLGTEMTETNDEVIDAIAELANMVAGSAKAKLDFNPPLELGLPTVVEGAGYRLKYPSSSAWLEVPFTTDCGGFSMEVSYADSNA